MVTGVTNDHLQEAGPSRWSFQDKCPSWWSFSIEMSLRVIICKRQVPTDDHFQEAGPTRWSFAICRPLQMINNNNKRRQRRRNSCGRADVRRTGALIEGSSRGPRGPKKKSGCFCLSHKSSGGIPPRQVGIILVPLFLLPHHPLCHRKH